MFQVFLVFGLFTAMNIGIGHSMIDHSESVEGTVEINSLAVNYQPASFINTDGSYSEVDQ